MKTYLSLSGGCENIPVHLQRIGQIRSDKRRLLDKIARRYIGNPLVNEEDRILNFSRMENRRIDKSGLIILRTG